MCCVDRLSPQAHGGQSSYEVPKGENDCCVVLYGSRGVSISNRRSVSLQTNTNPYSTLPSACHPSPWRRSIAAAIALDRSVACSRRWHSSTCQCRSHTTT